MSDEKLHGPTLPCPFCGGTKIETQEGSTFRWWYASCGECGAQAGEIRRQTLGEGTNEEWDAQARADALAAWNRRAALAPSPEPAAAGELSPEESVLWQALGTWSIEICRPDAELAPPQYVHDAIKRLVDRAKRSAPREAGEITDEAIVEARDRHLPSQGDSFDCIAFAREIEALATKVPREAGEVVAWLIMWPNSHAGVEGYEQIATNSREDYQLAKEGGYEITPLCRCDATDSAEAVDPADAMDVCRDDAIDRARDR